MYNRVYNSLFPAHQPQQPGLVYLPKELELDLPYLSHLVVNLPKENMMIN